MQLSFLFVVLLLVSCGPSMQVYNSNSNIPIVGGTVVSKNEDLTRWTVGLGEVGKFPPCGTVIISSNAVLTAGHCVVYAPNPTTTHSLVFSENFLDTAKYRKIKKVIMHPNFKHESPYSLFQKNDLAILIFEGDLPSSFEPVELDFGAKLNIGDFVVLAGFGKDENGDYPLVLKKTSVPIVETSNSEFKTDETASGSCIGDSGGPAYITVSNKKYLRGIVSRGDDKCREFGIYTDVSFYKDWIDEVLRSNPKNSKF